MDEFKLTAEERELILERRKAGDKDAEIKRRFDQVMTKQPGSWTPDEVQFMGQCCREALDTFNVGR
jgi:hypothetical protein